MKLASLLLALASLPVETTLADIAEELNRVRLAGCERHAGVTTPLRPTKAMNEVAREWSRGGRLRDAIQRTERRLEASSSMHVEGSTNEATLVEAIVENSCEEIVDPRYTQIGVHRTRDEVWVVVGKPFDAPDPGSAAEVSERALQLVNAARSKARKCGRTSFPAAPPLELSPLLHRAALAHAKDMAKHSRFEHVGSDGSRPAERVTRVGYKWQTVAENIAAGAQDIETAIQGWIDSPGHCANLMDRRYQEMGIAFAVDVKSDADIYWAQVFGTRR